MVPSFNLKSEPEFYGELVYKFRKIIGKNDFQKDNCSL